MKTSKTLRSTLQTSIIGSAMVATMLMAGCGDMLTEQPSIGLRIQNLDAVCDVPVQGHGTVNMDNDYIPNVIACESAPNSSLETLKAQAIAARTYAVFKLKVEKQSHLTNGTSNQVYKCSYNTPSALHFQAAKETAGQIITDNGLVTAGFYVSGVKPTTSTCIPSARDKANANATDRRTEGYITYNEGRFGSNLIRANSPMGHPGNPHNVGVYSQNGAKCLGDNGRSSAGILRFYYGSDIKIETMPGACGGSPTNPADPGDTGSTPPDDGACQTSDQAPTILPRSSWGARTPKANRAIHSPNKLTIHHTMSNAAATGPSAVRQVQDWHMDGNGWNDIGYHFLIDKSGTIYAANPENRVGAHTKNQNTGNLGISLIGNFETTQLPEVQKRAAASLIKHLAKKYNITVNRNQIKGHGERMATACPGKNVDLDAMIEMSKADQICDPTEEDENNIDPMYTYELPDLQVGGGDVMGYKFLRLTHIDGDPFILDAAYIDQGQGREYVTSVTGSAENGNAATGKADVETCDQLSSKAARIPVGGQATLNFDRGLSVSSIFVIQGQAVTVLDDCEQESFNGRVKVEASTNGQDWDLLNESVETNSTVDLAVKDFDFVVPEGNTAPRQATFEVKAPQNVVRVDYYAEKHLIGSGTKRGDNYRIEYKFQDIGKRLISAWGYDSKGTIIAMAERFVVITDGIDFIAPSDGETYKPNMSFTVATTDEINKVIYLVNDMEVGGATQRGTNFRFDYFFKEYGKQNITAIGYNGSKEIARAKISIIVDENGSNFRFINPKGGGVYKETTTFLMEVTDPRITKVTYTADGQFLFGESQDANSQFSHKHTFNKFGKRKIEAKGYGKEGNHLATATILITITDANGTVPDGSDNYDPGNDPSNPGGGGTSPNMELAGDLATEAYKRTHPTYGNNFGKGSKGYCWAYVKAAMERAKVTQPAGYNGAAYSKLDKGVCNLHLSAYCFGKSGEANPQGMYDGFQMEQVDIAPSSASRGDVIVWGQNCVGYNAKHGHIEVAQGDGTACSDFCGKIKTGGKSCSQVFRIVSSQGTTSNPPATSNTQVGDACTLNGKAGACLRSSSTCGGEEGQGSCGSGQKCCVKGCSVSSNAGQCLNTGACMGTSTPGHCPGPSAVQCCTSGSPTSNPSTACLKDLQTAGVNYSAWSVGVRYAGGRKCSQSVSSGGSSNRCNVTDPIKVTTPINGVGYKYVDSSSQRSYVSASCQLGDALRQMGTILKQYNIVQVIDIGTYCCRYTSGGGLSNHSKANAIDVFGFVDSQGTRYILEDHWEHNTTSPKTQKGKVLYEIAQKLHNSGAFSLVLTPNYNSEHDNHFHLDTHSTGGVKLQKSYIGNDPKVWEASCDH